MTRLSKVAAFRAAHLPGRPLIMPNAWDAGTARLLSSLGFAALGSTSAGYAFSRGRRDSFAALSRTEILANAAEIAQATELPVSADTEDGFGPAPEDCAETVRRAAAAGMAGVSIEDATGDPEAPIHAFSAAVERVEAAAAAAREADIVLTARAENFLWGRADLDDTLKRLRAFAAVGAEVLYAPGLPDLAAIATVCRALDRPVNVVAGLNGEALSVADLAGVGVARISTGGSLARLAFGAVQRAAMAIRDTGEFSYATDAIPDAALAALMSDSRVTDRG